MALKKIHTTNVGRCSVKIYRNAEWDEYVVKTVVNGKTVGGKKAGGYFTGDKHDARSTAAKIVRDLKKRSVCRK